MLSMLKHFLTELSYLYFVLFISPGKNGKELITDEGEFSR
jgi:hypothetical protein